MQRRKWFVPVVVVLSVLLIGGITGGIVAAAGDDSSSIEEQTEAADRYQVLLGRACAIYEESTGVAINSGQLMDALKQARQEMRDEALETWLQKLVEDGKITQGEAGQYLEWWQSRPDIELPLPALGKLARAFQIRVAPWCALGAPNEAGG